MKMIEVVAAIIERDGKILLAQRPAQSDQAGLWEFAGGKVEPDESQRQALVRELREELGIEATVGEYVTSHQREVSGRIIHLHAWHVPDFHGTLQAHEHQALCTQCCVYQDKNYSEGAVIKAEGILLQCQRDDKTLSTNPLVWRRVKP